MGNHGYAAGHVGFALRYLSTCHSARHLYPSHIYHRGDYGYPAHGAGQGVAGQGVAGQGAERGHKKTPLTGASGAKWEAVSCLSECRNVYLEVGFENFANRVIYF